MRFNVCKYQPLQKMTGPPLKLRVKEGAEPVALHQHIPLSHHWQQEVLAGGDQESAKMDSHHMVFEDGSDSQGRWVTQEDGGLAGVEQGVQQGDPPHPRQQLQQECQCDPEEGPNCGPGLCRLVLAGSRFLKDAETRYSPS